KDPVCGATLDRNIVPEMYCYNGKMFHFYSEGCCDKFSKKPGRYLGRHHRRRLPPRMSLPVGRMKVCYHQ
ncbi:MAG: YHS domain-containing protein, partial [Planctomycetota bacterium]